MADYLFEQWDQEKRRLDALGALHDRDTMDRLTRAGLTSGWRCLEVGAGSGTVARWMSERVGASGRVLATDINPRIIETLAGQSFDVQLHDIAADRLDEGVFDLVHARAVLQHVPRRDVALARMVRALRPGGVLVLEDIVMPHPACHPPLPAWGKILDAIERGLRGSGADPYYGLALEAELARASLRSVGGDATVAVMRSGTPSIDFAVLSVEQVGPRLVAAGLLSQDEIDMVLQAFRGPGYTLTSAIVLAAWGTRS